MHTPELREPRLKPTQKYQVTALKESVLDKINKIDLELQQEWGKEEVREIEDYPYNSLR
jgi:hypothetical protein